MYESQDKMVSHPSHYQSESGLEVITVIEAFTEGLTGIEACDTGNVLKYTCRWKQKNGLQDLEKAMWYLQHLIDHVKNANKVSIKEVSNDIEMYATFDNPKFSNPGDAKFFIESIQTLAKEYGKVTLDDTLNLLGLEHTYKGDEYGWTETELASIRFSHDPFVSEYVIELPKPTLL